MAAMTTTYSVTAKRCKKGWELHIDGVGVTQARRLSEADPMARDLIARREEVPEESFALVFTYEVSEELDAEVKAARAAVADLSQVQEATAKKSRAVAKDLRESGLDKKEVAAVLGVSPQRVSQLLRAHTALQVTVVATVGTLASTMALLMRLF
jgi:hypothetical protein